LRQQLDRSLQRIHDLENSMTVSPSKSASRRSWADESGEHSLAGASDSRESELTRLTVRCQALCLWCVCRRLCLECGRADCSAPLCGLRSRSARGSGRTARSWLGRWATSRSGSGAGSMLAERHSCCSFTAGTTEPGNRRRQRRRGHPGVGLGCNTGRRELMEDLMEALASTMLP
jgi:hypothetical protein